MTTTFLKTMSSRLFSRNNIIVLISSLLASLFVYTGLNKLMDNDVFKAQLGRSPFIQGMAGIIATALPTGELLIAILLCIPPANQTKLRLPGSLKLFLSRFPSARLLGLYLSYGLMLLFTGYIYIMLHYAYDLPCSCGGVLSSLSWKDHLIFNSIFTIIAFVGVILQTSISRIGPKTNKYI